MHTLFDRNWKGLGIDLSPVSLPHVAVRMFSCVGCFWVLLSSALVAICSFSFISPAWIVKDHLKNKDSVSFGLLWHCSESLDHMYRCYTFGGLGKFQEIPSSSWQTSAVLCSGGCALLAVSSLLAIITIFLPSGACERRICTLAGYMQMAAEWLDFSLGSSLCDFEYMQQQGFSERSRDLLLSPPPLISCDTRWSSANCFGRPI
ncbi:hypothetical protein QQF64_027405 [Cirrhinus molitorella]|uniref:Uncharacterized protein n=1 Tax=Cirrhinus molitorella TaxID=172907 RepID=A0ABR3NCN9_9TELE